MEPGAIIVMIFALLALIGVVVFFVYDYFKHKDSNVKDFRDTSARIDTEKSDRLSNLKFVVDQVNDVNNDIYNTLSSNVSRLDVGQSNLLSVQNGMLGGIDKFIRFSSNVIEGGTAPTIKLTDLPGTTTPNVELIQHITALMGVTVKDLDGTDGNKVEFCSKEDPNRCVRIPDSSGNMVLTGLKSQSSVIVDAPLVANSSVQFAAPGSVSTNPVSLSSDGSSMFVQGSKVAVGNGFTDPSAKLHIKTEDGMDALKVSLPASDAILVSADGTLVTSQPIVMKTSLTDADNVARFSVENDTTNNTKYIKLQTNRLHIQGDLSVSGNAKVNNQNVAVVSTTTV